MLGSPIYFGNRNLLKENLNFFLTSYFQLFIIRELPNINKPVSLHRLSQKIIERNYKLKVNQQNEADFIYKEVNLSK